MFNEPAFGGDVPCSFLADRDLLLLYQILSAVRLLAPERGNSNYAAQHVLFNIVHFVFRPNLVGLYSR